MDYRENKTHLLTDNQQTVVALCTPRGSGAIGLIRLSGDDAVVVAGRIAKLGSGKKLYDCSSHTIHFGHVVDETENNIDSVLFLLMRGPKTFTGQDTVEITCHNNPFIIERIIQRAITAGARLAGAGEFTRRAFLNQKVDLIQAEAIADIIHAPSQEALIRSMEHVEGSLSTIIKDIRHQLVTLLAFVEASFEFLDEEQRDFDFDVEIKRRISAVQESVASIKKDYQIQQHIKEGLRLVILGSVNVGKSTLFNALLHKDRAIVSPTPGTTRDSIESTRYRDGTCWLFVDTAGLRQTDDVIEQQGIERSTKQASIADIILLVFDAEHELSEVERKEYKKVLDLYESKSIIVINKIDKRKENELYHFPLTTTSPIVYVAAQYCKGLDELEAMIEEKKQALYSSLSTPFLLNQRQYSLLSQIEQDLGMLALHNQDPLHYEVVANQLQNLVEKASELTGEKVSEQVLDMIFNQFCVGK